jgi:hypothetical protein
MAFMKLCDGKPPRVLQNGVGTFFSTVTFYHQGPASSSTEHMGFTINDAEGLVSFSSTNLLHH